MFELCFEGVRNSKKTMTADLPPVKPTACYVFPFDSCLD